MVTTGERTPHHALLIVSVVPQNLEKDAKWYDEHSDAIKRAQGTNPWWNAHALVIEESRTLPPSEFIRRLTDFGYERAKMVNGKGLFAVRGGVIDVWPINCAHPQLVEFNGNRIATILTRERELVARPPIMSIKSIDQIPIGGYIVHEDHGIGIFRGTTFTETSIDNNEHESYYLIEYAPPKHGRPPDRLFVPISEKGTLTPYIGFETPTIHRLGGSVWVNTKRRVKKATEDMAKELLLLYAARHIADRTPHEGDASIEALIRDSFPYQETEDQLNAERNIFDDFSKTVPSDRILCGDVGFGKTEIAIRAALRVIASGKQVAVLSPTTILAAQHEKTFQERFTGLPVSVAMLSRLTPKQDVERIIADLKRGAIDCVIGTHRLFSKDITLPRLGLLVIDEEQRFGVKQKEHFKKLRSEIDILSLSATPIPRTLQFALARLRDISVIETPPPERLPIATIVLPHTKKIIREAIEFELERNGQVYFLHNRIGTIHRIQMDIASIMKDSSVNPSPKIGILHGRMSELEIIRVMESFRKKSLDILLATTIIENGLDISSANTLIVDDATKLGLAEMHQLRGRIGRSSMRAYAYFLYKQRHMTERAIERLDALREYAALGSGYNIALRDLEIRGAGNILGKEQSGAINKVGLNLYCQMLGNAVELLREKDIAHSAH